jgi:hypothetical protein
LSTLKIRPNLIEKKATFVTIGIVSSVKSKRDNTSRRNYLVMPSKNIQSVPITVIRCAYINGQKLACGIHPIAMNVENAEKAGICQLSDWSMNSFTLKTA